jgi:hypothetical protein
VVIGYHPILRDDKARALRDFITTCTNYQDYRRASLAKNHRWSLWRAVLRQRRGNHDEGYSKTRNQRKATKAVGRKQLHEA